MTFSYISTGRTDPILEFIHLIPQKPSEYILRIVKYEKQMEIIKADK